MMVEPNNLMSRMTAEMTKLRLQQPRLSINNIAKRITIKFKNNATHVLRGSNVIFSPKGVKKILTHNNKNDKRHGFVKCNPRKLL